MDVIAAGEADIAAAEGNYIGLEINNNSGHFLPSDASLQIAKDQFGGYGIFFPD
jgi:hypothetical protein